jgi:hypothetical protein
LPLPLMPPLAGAAGVLLPVLPAPAASAIVNPSRVSWGDVAQYNNRSQATTAPTFMNNNRRWSRADLARLHCLHGRQTLAQIAAALNRSYSSIQTKVQRLGLLTRHPWSMAEKALVRRHYRRLPTVELAKRMGRKTGMVYQEADRLGLMTKRSPRPARFAERLRELTAQGWCNPHICQELGWGGRQTLRRWRCKLGLPPSAGQRACPRCQADTGLRTREQCRQAGLENLAQTRSQVFHERAAAAGWPYPIYPREVQILNLLWSRGPQTRREIAAAIGMPWKGSRRSLTARCPGGSYLAHLQRLGLVIRMGRDYHRQYMYETFYGIAPGVEPNQGAAS